MLLKNVGFELIAGREHGGHRLSERSAPGVRDEHGRRPDCRLLLRLGPGSAHQPGFSKGLIRSVVRRRHDDRVSNVLSGRVGCKQEHRCFRQGLSFSERTENRETCVIVDPPLTSRASMKSVRTHGAIPCVTSCIEFFKETLRRPPFGATRCSHHGAEILLGHVCAFCVDDVGAGLLRFRRFDMLFSHPRACHSVELRVRYFMRKSRRRQKAPTCWCLVASVLSTDAARRGRCLKLPLPYAGAMPRRLQTG